MAADNGNGKCSGGGKGGIVMHRVRIARRLSVGRDQGWREGDLRGKTFSEMGLHHVCLCGRIPGSDCYGFLNPPVVRKLSLTGISWSLRVPAASLTAIVSGEGQAVFLSKESASILSGGPGDAHDLGASRHSIAKTPQGK
jgi:hypothetical protein